MMALQSPCRAVQYFHLVILCTQTLQSPCRAVQYPDSGGTAYPGTAVSIPYGAVFQQWCCCSWAVQSPCHAAQYPDSGVPFYADVAVTVPCGVASRLVNTSSRYHQW